MFKDVIGEWPMHERFILTSCDDNYFDQYFPRFYNTYKENWHLPIHVHIIDPSDNSISRLQELDLSYTHCTTDPAVLKWPYSYVTYCQAQRFILLGHNLSAKQSVIVADVDSYALREPTETQKHTLESDMAFTEYNGRLMATFCNFHHCKRAQALESAIEMQQLIENTDTIGVDQLVIKQTFGSLSYNNLTHNEWIRHLDVKTADDLNEHNKCLIYHEKGTRGKGKGISITWNHITE
tara:strand:- start:805 stop:1515 length:711 start_codon:yes stop_codon:yes gene_type:complete